MAAGAAFLRAAGKAGKHTGAIDLTNFMLELHLRPGQLTLTGNCCLGTI